MPHYNVLFLCTGIGGSDAGISAALRARELAPETDITVLLDDELPAAAVMSTANDHKAYYPGATPLHFRVTGDRDTGRLLGAQMLGRWGAEISKRVDISASTLFQGMTVDQVSDLDSAICRP